jgi:protein-S-isoprenylcysteine O-methyltransferase Ste14
VSRALVALLLEVVFFGLAFGWRSWVQWRRTGSTGFIRPRRGAGAAELVGSSGFVVALALLVAAPVADLADMARIELLDTTWAAAAGVALGICGVALTLVAQFAMGDSWRIGVDPATRTDLVTTGVFRSVRNPIFTAMIVATVGLVLLVPNPVSAAALLALIAALEVQVRLVEEPYLRTVHGPAYEAYLTSAGRFVPGVGLAPAPR